MVATDVCEYVELRTNPCCLLFALRSEPVCRRDDREQQVPLFNVLNYYSALETNTFQFALYYLVSTANLKSNIKQRQHIMGCVIYRAWLIIAPIFKCNLCNNLCRTVYASYERCPFPFRFAISKWMGVAKLATYHVPGRISRGWRRLLLTEIKTITQYQRIIYLARNYFATPVISYYYSSHHIVF